MQITALYILYSTTLAFSRLGTTYNYYVYSRRGSNRRVVLFILKTISHGRPWPDNNDTKSIPIYLLLCSLHC